MAIGLGRTIGSPIFLFFQIIHGVSLFFLMLGVSRVLLGILELSTSEADASLTLKSVNKLIPDPQLEVLQLAQTPADIFSPRTDNTPNAMYRNAGFRTTMYDQQILGGHMNQIADAGVTARAAAAAARDTEAKTLSFSTKLSNCFHVPLESLFHSPVAIHGETKRKDQQAASLLANEGKAPLRRYDGSASRFYAQHLVAAVLCAYPLALLLQRRKFVLDFVVTIYLAYWLFTDVMLQAVLGGGTWHWWGACLAGVATMYATTYLICRHKEMQEVKLSNGVVSVNGTAAGNFNVVHVSAPTNNTVTTTSTWLKEDAQEMEEVRPAFHDGLSPGGAATVASSTVAGLFQDRAGSDGGGRARATLGATSPKPAVADMGGSGEVQFKSKSV